MLHKSKTFISLNESLVLRLEKTMIEGIAKAEERGLKIPCKAGCSACCHQIVTINITDAIRIAKRMLTMDDEEIERVRLKAETAVKVNRRIKFDSQRWAEQIPCSFLVDDSCSIYQDRPIVCRATVTVEKEGYCDQLLQDKNPRGHEVLGLEFEGLGNEDIDRDQLFQLADVGVLPANEKLWLYCSQIDLDKLALFMARPTLPLRKANFNKLRSLDKIALKSLKKSSSNLGDEDAQAGTAK